MVSEEEQTDIAAILPDISAEIVPSKPTVTKPVPSQGEPPRVYRRLQTLRGWSHEYDEEIFPGGAGTSCSVSH